MSNTKADIAESLHGIFPHHLAELRRSGLTDATIRAAQIQSQADCNALAAILGWRKYRKAMGAALVFPYTDDQGRNGYTRIKPDRPRKDRNGKPIKYESPRGQPNQVYIPPGVADALPDAHRELLLTEGEKKALAAMQAGFPCLGLVGVFGWAEKNQVALLPALERVAWNGRRVFLVFDSDRARKPDVLEAEARLASHLANHGARVRVAQLPDGPPTADGNPTKVGLDDFLVAQGAVALLEFRRLLDAAVEPSPPDSGTVKIDARSMDAAIEAHRYLERSKRDGACRLLFWRGTFYGWKRGRYAELPTSEVRADVIRYLNPAYSRLTMTATGNVLDQVKAQGILSSATEPPAWIGSDPGPWPPDEILATRESLIHLPGFAAGAADYQRPATPRFFTTSALDYVFQPDALESRQWLQFLSELWGSDQESIHLLQEFAGYILTPDTRQQKILFLVGPKRSGKGTICRILRAMVGSENTAGPTLASLADRFGCWSLLGKTLAIVPDARLGRADAGAVVERLLAISGEDALTIDRKCLEPVTCKLPTRLMLVSNELPRLIDASGAMASRVLLLRLTESFYEREDTDLTARLLGELPGILRWAVQGWKRLRDRGRFVQPASGAELLDELQALTSPMGEFVRERCHIGPGARVSTADLFGAYREWAKEKGRDHTEDEAGFGRLLRAACPGISRRQAREDGERRRFYEGIGLRAW